MSDFHIVILAAGKGTRMKNEELPKALVPLKGKPMVRHLLESVSRAGFSRKPIIVIGHKGEKIKAELTDSCEYVVQAEQLGTGHAVSLARQGISRMDAAKGHVLVLYGDHPLVSEKTLKAVEKAHLDQGAHLTMATTTVPDFEEWRKGFYDFGRILRNEEGRIVGIIEKKDATDAQKEIKEINPAYFCFNAEWLWDRLGKLKNDNAQKEYYLTDLVKLAFEENLMIGHVSIPVEEALGINSKEQLELVEEVLSRRGF